MPLSVCNSLKVTGLVADSTRRVVAKSSSFSGLSQKGSNRIIASGRRVLLCVLHK